MRITACELKLGLNLPVWMVTLPKVTSLLTLTDVMRCGQKFTAAGRQGRDGRDNTIPHPFPRPASLVSDNREALIAP